MKTYYSKDELLHMCDFCIFHPAECTVLIKALKFGKDTGNDNVIACNEFENGSLIPNQNIICKEVMK